MSTIAASSNKKDFLEENRSVDPDDLTNSSIFDFLKKEHECFNSVAGGGCAVGEGGDDGDATEIDVDSLFEEINRLSDNTDDRSVDEILREAEILISKQQPLGGRRGVVGDATGATRIDGASGDSGIAVSETGASESVKDANGAIDGRQSPTFSDRKSASFEQVVDAVCPDSVISQESAPNELKTDVDDTTTSDLTDSIGTISYHADEAQSMVEDNATPIASSRTSSLSSSPSPKNRSIKSKSPKKSSPKHSVEKSIETEIPKNKNASQTFSIEPRRYCDRSTNSTPPIQSVSNATSPIDNFSISREYALKHEIEILQERLKDTEERLQSLRIQHDSLSHLHRDLRDSHSRLQEESELLKLDVQHLTDCANILRSELQSARNDRNEALDVQKLLQGELEESRMEKKSAQEKCERDVRVIQDLQRQCKEMERILMRKHPDSVSALIVASKNPGRVNDDTSAGRRLLEQRIAQLESDAKEQDLKAQKILANVQARFNSVQSKYETHIADLETQVLSLQKINTQLNEKIESQMKLLNKPCRDDDDIINHSTQTDDLPPEKESNTPTRNSSTQTDTSRPNSSTATRIPSKKIPTTSQTPNKMSVSHSDTTISTYHAAAKEDAHLLATIRGMRIDLALKDKAMQRLTRELEECKKTIRKLQKEKDAIKSEKPFSAGSSSSGSRKSYDPSMFAEHSADSQALKEALNKIKLLEHDYKALHDKRLQDLKTLQAAHERELASSHETVRVLQQRLAERDEAFVTQKRRKVPIDYYALKAKVSSLERRHSEREQRLHMLVEALSKGRLNGSLDDILADNGQ